MTNFSMEFIFYKASWLQSLEQLLNKKTTNKPNPDNNKRVIRASMKISILVFGKHF